MIFCIVGNTCLVWSLMCLTEALMIRALLLTNFKQFNGINDSFFSMFAGLINIGFSLGSHIALFILGSLGSDEILTGLRGKPRQMSLFYNVTMGTLTTISCFSIMVIGIKKIEAYQKDKKLVKEVNVMINNTDSRDSKFKIVTVNLGEHNSNIFSIPVPAISGKERPKSAPPVLRPINRPQKLKPINKRYNSPVASIVILASFTILVAGNILAFIVVVDNVYGSTSYYIKGFWFGSAGSIFVRAFLPIWYITFYHTDFRTFIFKTWRDLWLNVCLQKNRVQPTHPA